MGPGRVKLDIGGEAKAQGVEPWDGPGSGALGGGRACDVGGAWNHLGRAKARVMWGSSYKQALVCKRR